MSGIPRIYTSFAEFTREELRRLDSLHTSVDDLVEERFAARFPKAEVWHVVGGDLVAGGGDGTSEIQRTWQKGAEIWQRLRFAILTRGGSGMSVEDLPPRSELVDVSDLVGSGTEVRKRLAAGKPVAELLDPAVEEYVRAHGLYRS